MFLTILTPSQSGAPDRLNGLNIQTECKQRTYAKLNCLK